MSLFKGTWEQLNVDSEENCKADMLNREQIRKNDGNTEQIWPEGNNDPPKETLH